MCPFAPSALQALGLYNSLEIHLINYKPGN